MYKILIVEDDVMYRYAIKTLIKGGSGRYRFLEEAINGKHALEIIEGEKPDIIITDISMPEMNGVELIKRVKSSHPDIKVLVLSAYDDFHFVKEALKHGAEDYLLKYELDENCVNELLNKICGEIEKERRSEKRDTFLQANTDDLVREVFRKIVSGRETGPVKIDEFLELLYPNRPHFPLSFAVFQVEPEAARNDARLGSGFDTLRGLVSENPRLYAIEWEDWIYVLVFNLSSIPSFGDRSAGFSSFLKKAVHALSASPGTKVFAGMSGPITDAAGIAGGFRRASHLLEKGFYNSVSTIFYPPADKEMPKKPIDLPAAVAVIVRCLDTDDATGAALGASRLFDLIRKEQSDLAVVDETVRALFSELFILAKNRRLDFSRITGCEKLPSAAREFASKLDDLERFVEECLRNFFVQEVKPELCYRREVRLTIDYIKRHYRREIQLSALAAELGLSPNYLCSLFKRETGMRLFEYVHKVRIHEAINLLKNSNLKVYEIAEKTGFRSVSYFCQTFKDVMGRPLSEFKKTVL
jgi:DNA-binding NarL/FixJ family response regulator/AraC-like DNA-binding protein